MIPIMLKSAFPCKKFLRIGEEIVVGGTVLYVGTEYVRSHPIFDPKKIRRN
ncbi:MAG: hypothetical protein ABR981_03535 [Candidatus Micrarchaeaceae archaeon]|jgi:hypothetical protein